MATYTELRNLFNKSEIRNRVEAACIIKAQAMMTAGGATVDERRLALAVIDSPTHYGERVLKMLLAANKDAAVPAIESVSDSAIQAQVDTALPLLVGVVATA